MNNLDNDYDFTMKKGDIKISTEDLSVYELPQHKFPIEYFRILWHDVYESEKRHLPNVILTIT